jgi:biopolymer transport protein ExbD
MKAAVVVVALAGCIDTGPGPQPTKKVDAQYVQQHVLRALPDGVERWNVGLGGRVVYLGNAVSKKRIAPGETLTITHYWQALRPIGPEFRVFALVRGAPGTADFMNLPATDMEIARPPATWLPGEIIADEQPFMLRADWKSASATVLVGLIEVGAHDTLDRMTVTAGPHTRERAVVAADLEIDLAHAPPPLGTVYIPRARGAITIDGSPNDPGWAGAVVSPEFPTGEGSSDPAGKATARMTWDDQYLYVFASVVDSDITTPYTKHDDTLWKADAVEMFIDADSNRRGYIELQVNANNATFDSWFPGGRAPKGDEAWDSGMQTVVRLNGTTKPGDADTSWDVEIAIPWAAVKGRDDKMTVQLPPKVGDRWRLNVVRVDVRSSSDKTMWASWNRIGTDFHGLDRMLVAVFADSNGSIVPSTTAEQQQTATPAPPTVTIGQAVGSGAPPMPEQETAILVQLRASGDVVIRGRVVSDADLTTFLRATAARDKDTSVTVAPEAGVPTAKAMALLERIKQAGLTRSALSSAPR